MPVQSGRSLVSTSYSRFPTLKREACFSLVILTLVLLAQEVRHLGGLLTKVKRYPGEFLLKIVESDFFELGWFSGSPDLLTFCTSLFQVKMIVWSVVLL